MEVNSFKMNKVNLCNLIKLLSDLHGGDEIEFLREYCREIVAEHKNDLSVPIKCFGKLINDLMRYK